MKLVISEAASSDKKETVLLVVDVRRAYFCAMAATRRIYVGLPEEGGGGLGSQQCGLLRKSFTAPVMLLRTGSASWRFLEEIGLRRGKASTCLCSVETPGISASVHGDDITVKASREDAECLMQRFMEKFEIKTQMIGEAADGNKQLQILTGTVRWSS